MKVITLRTLIREPLKVKRMTRGGFPVQVTDKGRPLWTLHPVAMLSVEEPARRAAIEEVLTDVLAAPIGKISAGQLLEESRR